MANTSASEMSEMSERSLLDMSERSLVLDEQDGFYVTMLNGNKLYIPLGKDGETGFNDHSEYINVFGLRRNTTQSKTEDFLLENITIRKARVLVARQWSASEDNGGRPVPWTLCKIFDVRNADEISDDLLVKDHYDNMQLCVNSLDKYARMSTSELLREISFERASDLKIMEIAFHFDATVEAAVEAMKEYPSSIRYFSEKFKDNVDVAMKAMKKSPTSNI